MGEIIEGLLKVLNNEEAVKANLEALKKRKEFLERLGYKPHKVR